MFSVYNQISTPQDHVYKLVQLPPSLLELMKSSSSESLEFKAPSSAKNHLVICSDSETYTVRQMNHSNTVLLLNDMAPNPLEKRLDHLVPSEAADRILVGVGLSSYEYELTPTEGYIDTLDVPMYDGTAVPKSAKTVETVLADLPIAREKFRQQWHRILGCEIEGVAVLLSPQFVTDALYTLISVLVAERQTAFDVLDVAPRVQEENPKITSAVVNTLAERFCRRLNSVYELDETEIATWFGVETLKKTLSPVSDNELLLEWKSSLPPFFTAPLDLALLRGFYCRPVTGKVRYLARNSLSPEIHARIKEMFQMVREWDYDEFLPFVAEFIPPSKKADSVLLKYTRKRRVGKKVLVGPR